MHTHHVKGRVSLGGVESRVTTPLAIGGLFAPNLPPAPRCRHGRPYDANRRKHVVRWQADGRRRSRRFESEAEAVAFAETLGTRLRGRPPSTGIAPERDAVAQAASTLAARAHRDGIYAHETNAGTRWRFAFRQSGPETRVDGIGLRDPAP